MVSGNFLGQSDTGAGSWEALGATHPEGNSTHFWFSLVRIMHFIYYLGCQRALQW